MQRLPRQTAVYAATFFLGKERQAVCVPGVNGRIFMRWICHRIEDTHRYDIPGHTAYLNTFSRPCHKSFCRRKRESANQSTKPPPARPVTSTRYLNAYQAADFSQFSGVGRSFFAYRHRPRCRSPPIKTSRFTNDNDKL